jgi:hypothetical protein
MYRSFTVETRVQFHSNSCGFVAEKVSFEDVFLQILQFSPVSIIQQLSHTHISFIHHRCYFFSWLDRPSGPTLHHYGGSAITLSETHRIL